MTQLETSSYLQVRKFMDTWKEYEKIAIPADAPDVQREAMLHAFLTGAAIVVESIAQMTGDSVPRKDLVKRLKFMKLDIGSELTLRDPNVEKGTPN